ncbi:MULTISPECIES: glycosyl transferase, group 1 [unclassified Dolichospermum]|uniref:glycosyl transferase, group 1 n=1 Tax=unclassified Dolichospermum TaxID=2622029 RepID=UPI00144539CE|nr:MULTISPECIES: glycosyl transferase, group 1 [unclassified Dolichospermum]MTJ16849.1 glycosyl transferase, group 1 [Dolichospermum sp. UHCC 0299]MTJ41006.1 glycosyl transferase, group 1 [Dolichospermum sp. UHCC 0406]
MSKNAVCTVITKSYLPYARTLASSLAEHNPDVDLYVLLADKVDDYFDPTLEPFKFIYLEDLSDIQTVEQMCFYYTPFELCCALRGFLHEYMFEQTDAQKWLFLDSDIMVFNSLDLIFEQLENSSILLTPHRNNHLPIDYVGYEINFLKNGLYNAGFLGLQRTSISQKFISWFKDRLKSFAFNDFFEQTILYRGLFVDQLWLNLVPLYFDEVSFCLEPGANLGHWNLFGKTLSKDKLGNINVDQKPVLFVHFSGWDINNTNKVSKYAPMYEQDSPSLWSEISKNYRDRLIVNDYEKFMNYPYAFNYFHNGEFLTTAMRRQYYNNFDHDKNSKYSPFSNEIYCQLKTKLINDSQKTSSFTYLVNRIKSVIKKIRGRFFLEN